MSYCNKCKKNTKSLDEEIKKSKNNRFYSVSKCAICQSKKVRFVKDPKQGEGIIDNIKGFLKGPRKDYPPRVRNLFQKYKDVDITDIIVCREAISPSKILDILTLGAYGKAVKKLGYDSMFHLYMVMTLSNNEILRVEKNAVITMKPFNKELPEDNMNVSMSPINFVEFFENAKEYHEKETSKSFYLYNSVDNNCQMFSLSCLKGNGLGNAEIYDFIKQDVRALLDEIDTEGGFLEKAAEKITDIAGAADVLIEGLGKRKNKKSK